MTPEEQRVAALQRAVQAWLDENLSTAAAVSAMMDQKRILLLWADAEVIVKAMDAA